MSTLIYNVTETTGDYYEHVSTHVIFSTFDKEEAIAFGKNHVVCNASLADFYGMGLSTRVDSSEIGVPNTAERVWSYIYKKNTVLPLAMALLNKLKQAPVSTSYYQNIIKPSLGWALGTTPLLVDEQIINSVDINTIESYADSLASIDHEELADLAIAKLGTECSKMCADLSLNSQDWELFDLFEAHYF